MCGIVGAVAERAVAPILLEGLQRLEYRGYDSAGMAVIDKSGELGRLRRVGKVQALKDAQANSGLNGRVGISHTRWATHGKPTENNAHPHVSSNKVAVVHNGIIENHESLRAELVEKGYSFESETDTEVIAHLVVDCVTASGDFGKGVQQAVARLKGAYAVAVMHKDYPGLLAGARIGSPLVVGLGLGENFLASDPMALRPVTDRFVYLNEGEMVVIGLEEVHIYGENPKTVEERTVILNDAQDVSTKGNHRHFMAKEIYEQPHTIAATLEGRLSKTSVLANAFGIDADEIFSKVENVQIVACGSSFYTGLVAHYWIEEYCGICCEVEIASEFRYRTVAVPKNTLLVTISQSGETADTLAALRNAKHENYLASLCICNSPNSSLMRESDLGLLIKAGPEICVASTKAFTTQLADLMLLTLAISKHKGLPEDRQQALVTALGGVPALLEVTLEKEPEIKRLAESFVHKQHALFLGRGEHYPVAMEGALKLKEISYIHAEGYPAGELKHGPLALVDENMPVIAVAPSDDLLDKVKSNLQEVRARGGQLIVFAEEHHFSNDDGMIVIDMPACDPAISPIVYTIPLQLLAYHVAILKGTDVDQPRNLAKSVTVE